MIPDCINVGISLDSFWQMDLQEIRQYFKAYNQKAEREQKEELSKQYNLSMLISMMVNCQLTGHDIPSIKELYPEQFPTTAEDMQVLCAQFKAYADEYNASRKDKK